jgi:hypothetical protein
MQRVDEGRDQRPPCMPLRRGIDRERDRAMTEEPLVFLRKVGVTPSRESTTPHSEEEDQ